MPLTNLSPPESFFADPQLDDDLPAANQLFWAALLDHIEQDVETRLSAILDIGCHTGGLLEALCRRFTPVHAFGIEPLSYARLASMDRLKHLVPNLELVDPSDWALIPENSVDLATSHEVLYLEPDLQDFMMRLKRVLKSDGRAYIVLGCHAENPLWPSWKAKLIGTGRTVFDHAPLDIMEVASRHGFLCSVQPLRTSGWITYDPSKAAFSFPAMTTMLDHHYRHKLIFRLQAADEIVTP